MKLGKVQITPFFRGNDKLLSNIAPWVQLLNKCAVEVKTISKYDTFMFGIEYIFCQYVLLFYTRPYINLTRIIKPLTCRFLNGENINYTVFIAGYGHSLSGGHVLIHHFTAH